MRGTMILPGETAAGSAGMQPCRGIAWLGSSIRSLRLREYPSRTPATRIRSVEPDALKTTPEGRDLHSQRILLYAQAAHLQLARRLSCIAALGARNVKTASWKKVLKFARSRLSATIYRASAALRRLRLICLLLWQLRIPKASVSQCR